MYYLLLIIIYFQVISVLGYLGSMFKVLYVLPLCAFSTQKNFTSLSVRNSWHDQSTRKKKHCSTFTPQ